MSDTPFAIVWQEAEETLARGGLAFPHALPAPPPPQELPRDLASLAGLIDETLLKPEATASDVDDFLLAARDFPFRTVCVHGSFVGRAARALTGTTTGVAVVVGFPHGAASARAKATEARIAVEEGASEIDMVGPFGLLRSGDVVAYLDHVRQVRDAVPGATLKVILEISALTPSEIVAGSMLSLLGGADFVKTSTGFGGGGATAEAVALMRRTVGPTAGVKASGGIRDLESTLAMVRAGANRIGTSRGHAICRAFEEGLGAPS